MLSHDLQRNPRLLGGEEVNCTCGFHAPALLFSIEHQEEYPHLITVNGNPVSVNLEDLSACGFVNIDLSDFIDNDLDGILNIISDNLTTHENLMDTDYQAVAAKDGIVTIEVSGCMELDTWQQMLENADDSEAVTCKFCGEKALAATAHLHDGEHVGEECCWEERLRATE